MKLTLLVDPSLIGPHYYRNRLSDICLEGEKIIFNEIMHYHYMTYMATPFHKNPLPRGQ